jgi:(p)ppGpp synthase/HD superfamily hydrolase
MTPVPVNKPLSKLLHWIEGKYIRNKIKISGEPYFTHLLAVAETTASATVLGYEIGLCHDLLEDYPVSPEDLSLTLTGFGYTGEQAACITSIVVELTDVYTETAYPDLHKSERKAKETARLLSISGAAQTVKYADLIYNIAWTLKNEPQKAKKYLKKKKKLLASMTKGDPELRQLALQAIADGLVSLKE